VTQTLVHWTGVSERRHERIGDSFCSRRYGSSCPPSQRLIRGQAAVLDPRPPALRRSLPSLRANRALGAKSLPG
jgi:hypothetical protein